MCCTQAAFPGRQRHELRRTASAHRVYLGADGSVDRFISCDQTISLDGITRQDYCELLRRIGFGPRSESNLIHSAGSIVGFRPPACIRRLALPNCESLEYHMLQQLAVRPCAVKGSWTLRSLTSDCRIRRDWA